MGLRSLERKLAPEICYGVVAELVDEYLSQSKKAGRLLNPVEHLKMPILREGFHPPGLHEAVQWVAGLHPRRKKRWSAGMGLRLESVSSAAESDEELKLPDADELIRRIFSPYPVGRIRSHYRRRPRADRAKDRSIAR